MDEERARPRAASDSPSPQAGPQSEAQAGADEQLFQEQVQFVLRNVPMGLLGLLSNTVVLAYVLWRPDAEPPLRLWLAAVLVVVALRYLHYRWYRRQPRTSAQIRRWMGQFRAGVVVSAAVWGSVALLPIPLDITQLVFIAFLSGGLAAGVVAAYAAVAWLPELFILPATLGVALGLVLHGGQHALVMAGMVAYFTVAMVLMARGFLDVIRRGLQLRTTNEELVSTLIAERDRVAKLNADLRQEIAERSQAERSLRESEERFRSLVESATDGIGFTFEGHIYYANQAALDLIGYPAEEVLGQPIQQFLATTTLAGEELYERYQDRIAGREVPDQYETQMRRKDGTIVDVLFSNSTVTLDGRVGVMSLVKDITERKKAEQELLAAKETAEAATQLKDQFVSLLAHDLRAPLNSMFSMVRLLDSDPEHPLAPDQREVLRTVADQGDATLHMIEDLLSVSQLRTGKLQPQPRFVDASTVTATTIRQLNGIAREKRITVSDEVPHQTRLYTDPEMLGKVLYNLLSNAIKFAPRGGAVHIFIPEGRPATLAVADNGAGVSPALIPDLFRHEIKTTTPGSAGERGTGLGLPLSQDMMQALGGEIRLARTAEDGCEFHAMLPAVRPRVMVVGRDESLHLFVRPHLENIDVDCVAVEDAPAAALRMETEAVHLVIAEADLNSRSSLESLRQLWENTGHKPVPVVLITDRAEAGLMEHGYRMGADEIVVKPLVPNDFLLRLRRFII